MQHVASLHRQGYAMPITSKLREHSRVLYSVATDPLNALILNQFIPEQSSFYDRSPGKLHLIVNVSRVSDVPSGIIRTRRDGPIFQHPKRGLLIIVGANIQVRSAAEVFARLAHLDTIRFFDSEPEAWAYVREAIAEETRVQV